MTDLALSELSIVLVEPSAMQCKLITRQLKEQGVKQVEAVSTGADALQIIQSYPPDLLISSLYLPDMTADQLFSEALNVESTEPIHMMLISSETSFKALDPVKQTGVVAALPKPFDTKDLQRALRTTLDMLNPEHLELEHYDVSDLRVLLVDDSHSARNHISRVLNSLEIQNIDTVENGKQAIVQLTENRYDLIVTDLNMPEMDGQELAEYVRNEMGDLSIPILMSTTENNEAKLGNVQQAGVSAVVNKSFEPNTVKQLLKSVLD